MTLRAATPILDAEGVLLSHAFIVPLVRRIARITITTTSVRAGPEVRWVLLHACSMVCGERVLIYRLRLGDGEANRV